MITISVRNISSVVTDNDVKPVIAAVQKQISRDFFPVWGCDARIRLISKQTKPNDSDWGLIIADNSDQAGALGYHDMTAQGLPLGTIFAKTDIDAKTSWSNTISHEVLEMLGDPWINLCALDENNSRLFAVEVCDPCEDDSLGYKIDGVLVSDFIYPSWFEGFRKEGDRFDFGKNITKPFQILKGGYMGYMDIASSKGWQELTESTADSATLKSRANVGSRRERRHVGKDRWVASSHSLFIQ